MADSEFKGVSILVYPCSLPNPGDCATPAELKSLHLYVSRLRKTYDASNKDDPVKQIPTFIEGITVDPGFNKRYSIFLRTNEIWDDTLDFFSATKKASYIDIGEKI